MPRQKSAAIWRPMQAGDLPTVFDLAARIHADHPEGDDVFRDRLRLFPEGCLIAEDGEGLRVGYAVAHPGVAGTPPPLDSRMACLPRAADSLYIHDVALAEEARGLGLGSAVMPLMRDIARRHGLPRMALVAVNGSAPFWQREGFRPMAHAPASLTAKLASYGPDAAYLVADLGETG